MLLSQDMENTFSGIDHVSSSQFRRDRSCLNEAATSNSTTEGKPSKKYSLGKTARRSRILQLLSLSCPGTVSPPMCSHSTAGPRYKRHRHRHTHTHKQTTKHCSAKVCSRLSATRKNSETADIRSHAEPMPCEEALDRLLRILSFDPIRESLQRKTTNYGKRDKALNWSA